MSHHKSHMKFPRYRRFKNPHGGTKRKFSLYKRLYIFLKRLFHVPPMLPESFVVSENVVLKNFHDAKEDDVIIWLGHSTFLIKIRGKTILTDPFLSEYASPIHGLGPKRFSPPGITVSHLPKIDIIVVSHNHYDHCDLKTLRHLAHKEDIHVIIPLRLTSLFKKCGYKKINELDWYETWECAGIKIGALPAYHYSKRSLFTQNTSLWASFFIEASGKKIFFSGDTGYGSIFSELGISHGPFDYALVSIGAYDPPEYMLAGHLTPEQAVQVGRDLKTKTLVAMHWGTIILSDEPPLEPPLRFYHAAQLAEYHYDDIWVLNIGEMRNL